MTKYEASPSFEGDPPAAAECNALPDRRELALVAVERTRMPMVVTDPQQADNPIVLANQAFLDSTGYAADEVIGRNCRFLQGDETAALRRHGENECGSRVRVSGVFFTASLILVSRSRTPAICEGHRRTASRMPI